MLTIAVSYTHLRAHETPEHLVCRLLLEKKVDGENFTKFIVFKNSSKGPTLSWVEIGISDLANVEIKKGLNNGDQVFVLPSKGLVDYQNRFKERVKNSFG